MEYNYPDHKIDPYKKNKEWILKYAKAAWMDSATNVNHMFAAARKTYDEQRRYALCKQDTLKYISPYKKDEATDLSYMQIDARPRAFHTKYFDSMRAKMLQQEFRPTATPIDPTSVESSNDYYNQMKAKLAMKQQLAQSPLANHPALQMSPSEPQDMEELEMRMNFGEQFNRAVDAEQVISLAFYRNNIKMIREEMADSAMYHGVLGYKDDLDGNNQPYMRYVDPSCFVPTNYCKKRDFSDLQGGGEVIEVSKISLLKYFDQDEIDRIPSACNGWPTIGGYGNSGTNNKTAQVWDLCFFSTNTKAWQKGESKQGNPMISKTDPNKKGDNITTKDIQVVYCCKWVIGTDLIYDEGVLKNMKRNADPKKIGTTSLPYHFYAYNFHEMKCQSYMDRLMPIIDEAMHIVCKMQQFRNAMIPNGFLLDLDALEGVAMSKGGEEMSPKQVLKMFTQTGNGVWRSKDLGDNGINNYKPFEKMDNSNANEIIGLYNELQAVLSQMAMLTGFNEVTDGSTPNAKNLTATTEAAQTGTNNALFPLYNAMQVIELSAAENMLLRSKQSIKLNGNYNGFIPALNGSTMKSVSGDKDLTIRDHAIMLDIMATDSQRQYILTLMATSVQSGFIDESDIIQIYYTYNIKQSGMMLAYKIKKNKELQQQQKMQVNQQTIQGQQQSAMISEKAKQETIMVEYGQKKDIEKMITDRDVLLLKMQLDAGHMGKIEDNHGKIMAKHIEADGKRDVAQIGQMQPPSA